jgi:hypothetical protein
MAYEKEAIEMAAGFIPGSAKRWTFPGPLAYGYTPQVGQHGNCCPFTDAQMIENAKWNVVDALSQNDIDRARESLRNLYVYWYSSARSSGCLTRKQSRDMADIVYETCHERM